MKNVKPKLRMSGGDPAWQSKHLKASANVQVTNVEQRDRTGANKRPHFYWATSGKPQ